MLWRPDKMICLYEIEGVSIREEKFIAANDAAVSGEVSIVGDQLFLALHPSEVLKAAASFAGNEHVTTVKMSTLKLDNKFALELAKSIEANTGISLRVFNTSKNSSSLYEAEPPGLLITKTTA